MFIYNLSSPEYVLPMNLKMPEQYNGKVAKLEHTKWLHNKYKIIPRLLRAPREQAPWARNIFELFCIYLVFIWYVQAWRFVHGIYVVIFNLLTKPYSREDGIYIYISIVSFLPPCGWSQLFNAFPIYIYIYINIYIYICIIHECKEIHMHI